MKTGITLSGGGVRGVAHLAIIQELEKEGIVPEIYSGTSGGALVAALLSSGLSVAAIMDIVRKIKVFSAIKPALTLSGLLDMEQALSFALKYLPETFEELNFPVKVATTNMQTGMTEFHSSGPLIPPIVASCCVPVIFKPVAIKGQYHVDGGLLNNMPVEAIRTDCDKLIGVNTNPVEENFNRINMKGLLERTFLLTINANVAQRKQLCDVYLEPECLKGIQVFDLKKIPAIFQDSVSWIQGRMPDIKRKLEAV